MRLAGVLLIGFGATLAWYLGVKGEDLSTLRAQIFAFFGVADPGAVLPAAQPAPTAWTNGGLQGSVGAAASGAAGVIANALSKAPGLLNAQPSPMTQRQQKNLS